MDFQSNGTNGENEGYGLTDATPIFNGTSNVKRVVADPARENVLVLPKGTSLDDITVEGANLVIQLPDGTEMVVINGAVYVPEIVIDGVTVPPMNLAALLDSDQPQPASGDASSSGGNFADPVDPIDPAYALGDLLPYTELSFSEETSEEVYGILNRLPEITFIPMVGDGTVVDESGLQGNSEDRPETPGTMDETDAEATTGTILYVSPDGTDRLLIDGMDLFEFGPNGEIIILEPFVSGYELTYGTLVINAIDIEAGSITYTYTLNDNTIGDGVQDSFDITVIDPQGDSDTGTATIDIIDDVPFTNNDGVLATLDDNAAGVIVGTVDDLYDNDEFGADGMGDNPIVIGTGDKGGTIVIDGDGNLVYTAGAGGNVAPGETTSETFTYTIFDGDGSESNSSTFIINLTDDGPSIGDPDGVAAEIAVDDEDVDGFDGIDGGPDDLADEDVSASGTLTGLDFGFDGPGDVVLGTTDDTGLRTLDGGVVKTSWDADTHTLTGYVEGSFEDPVFELTLTEGLDGVPNGEYTFVLYEPVKHTDNDLDNENDAEFSVTVTVTDAEGDPAEAVINILIDDDTPTAGDDGNLATVDDNSVGVIVGTVAGILGNDAYGADGEGSTAIVIGSGDKGGTVSIVGGNLVYTSATNVAPGETSVETFSYSIFDGDGDEATASFTVTVDDEGPSIGDPEGVAAEIAVDDEDVPGFDGIDGGPDDLADEDVSDSGTLTGLDFGFDGPGDVVLSTTDDTGLRTLDGGVVKTSWDAETHTLTGYVEGSFADPVFTLVLTEDTDGVPTGAYTFTLNEPVKHADNDLDNENDATFSVTVTVTDAEGDPAEAVINILIDDDTPEIDIVGEPAAAVLDESAADTDEGDDSDPDSPYEPAGIASDTFDFSGNFSADNDGLNDDAGFGADGPGSVTYALNLTQQNVGSGLYVLNLADAETIVDGYGQGPQILLYQLEDGTIIGYTGESPSLQDAEYTTYFTISVNENTGVVTFTQLENVWHGDTESDDDTVAISPASGSINLVATITDADDDSIESDPLDLDGVFQIQDDGPAIVDVVTDAVDLSASQTQASGNLLDSDYVDIGTDSSDTFDGRIVEISYDGGALTDAIETDGTGYPLTITTDYGTLSVDADGDYTFTIDGTNSEIQTLGTGETLPIEFSYTLTDGDGDPETNTLTITIKGSNQPPEGSAQSAVVSEEGLDNGNEDTTDDPYGNGSPAGDDDTNDAFDSGSFAYDEISNPTGFSDPDGDDLTFTIGNPSGSYYNAAGTLITWNTETTDADGNPDANGDYQTVTGSADGEDVIRVILNNDTGDYDVYLDGPVYHQGEPSETDGIPDGDGNVESEFSITFPVTVSDGTVEDDVDTSLVVEIEDDSPEIAPDAEFTPDPLIVDDSDFGTDATSSFAGAFDIDFGGDGELDVFYALGVSSEGAYSGLVETTSGQGIYLYTETYDEGLETEYTVVEGRVGSGGVADENGAVAFTISVDADGDVTLDQDLPVVHDDTDDHEEAYDAEAETNPAETLASAGLVTLTATAYDQDGDNVSETIDIGDAFFFEDDGPSISAADPTDTGSAVTSDALLDDQDGFSLTDIFDYDYADEDDTNGVADFGNDGPADSDSIVEEYGLDLLIAEDGDSGLDSGGDNILLRTTTDNDTTVVITGYTDGTDIPGSTVFTITVDKASGDLTLDQYGPIDHVGEGNDDQIALPENLIDATYSVTITDGDGDSASDSKSEDLSGHIAFNDDEPAPTANGDPAALVLDESPDPIANPDYNPETDPEEDAFLYFDEEGDFDPAGRSSVTVDFSALFDPDGTDGDDIDFGADVPGTVDYALVLDIPQSEDPEADPITTIGSGIYALDNSDVLPVTDGEDLPENEGDTYDGDGLGQGEEILLSQLEDGSIIGFTGDLDGAYTEYFTITVDNDPTSDTYGSVTFTQTNNVWHPDTSDDDDTVSLMLEEGILLLQATATDYDGDSETASVDLGAQVVPSEGDPYYVFQIEDDGPAIVATDDAFLTAGEGDVALTTGWVEDGFVFDIGTDGFFGGSAETGLLFEIDTTGLDASNVDGADIMVTTQPTYNSTDSTATIAVYDFTFTYDTDTGTIGFQASDPINGTLSVNLETGDYQVDLDMSFTSTEIVPFSTYINKFDYDLDPSPQAEVVVTELDSADPIFVQFEGFEAVNGNTPVDITAGGDNTFTNGEIFTGSRTYLSISQAANGVASDTIQDEEVLDFDLYSYNPEDDVNAVSDVSVTGLTLTLENVGANEDLIVVLKLVNTETLETDTRVVIVEYADIYTDTNPVPDAYADGAPVLGSTDGFVIIEQNDYLFSVGGDDAWEISGAQLLTSSSGVSGTGIDLNPDVGDSGDSDTIVAFGGSTTDDTDVIKIVDVGLIRVVETEETAQLKFDATIIDGDGDSETASFVINPDVVTPVVLDINGNGEIDLVGHEAGVLYDYGNGEGDVLTAWVADGDGILAMWDGVDINEFSADNFVFGGGGETDLEALNAEYGDVLDSGDADWSQFGVWVDDGDGDFEVGEFQYLSDLDITSINLIGDGVTYYTADGDAVVYQSTTYTVDGDTDPHLAGDVGFLTVANDDDPQAPVRNAEAALLAAVAPGLLIAEALNVTPAFDDPDLVNFEPTDIDFATVVNAITPHEVDLSHVTPMAGKDNHGGPEAAHNTHLSDDDHGGSQSLNSDAGNDKAPASHDLGTSSEAAADFAPPSTPASGPEVGGAVLEALVELGAPPQADNPGNAQGTGALEAVRTAMEEVTGTDSVSELVNHLIDNVPETAQHHGVGTEAIQALLNGGVAGQHFHMASLPDAADDTAQLAAASA